MNEETMYRSVTVEGTVYPARKHGDSGKLYALVGLLEDGRMRLAEVNKSEAEVSPIGPLEFRRLCEGLVGADSKWIEPLLSNWWVMRSAAA